MENEKAIKIKTVKEGLEVIHKLQATVQKQKAKETKNVETYKRNLDRKAFAMNMGLGALSVVAVGAFLVGWLVC